MRVISDTPLGAGAGAGLVVSQFDCGGSRAWSIAPTVGNLEKPDVVYDRSTSLQHHRDSVDGEGRTMVAHLAIGAPAGIRTALWSPVYAAPRAATANTQVVPRTENSSPRRRSAKSCEPASR